MPLLPLLLAAALPGDGPGTERVFGDWAVTCDNVKRCQAVALSPIPEDDGVASSLLLTREPGPGGATKIEFTPVESWSGIIEVLLDGRQVGSGYLHDKVVTLAGGEAEGLARAMATGRLLTLRGGRRILARYSLKGSSATLRYIDAEQGRAGGVTALVARGPKPAAAVPAARPVPRIAAIRPPKGKPATLGAAELRALAAQGGCEAGLPDYMQPGFHRLDARSILVMVPCWAGPSDFSHIAFVLRGGRAAPATFDWQPASGGGTPMLRNGIAEIIDYGWSDGELATSSKQNFPSGCSIVQAWVWDGERFRLTRQNQIGICNRWGTPMTAYRATPTWR